MTAGRTAPSRSRLGFGFAVWIGFAAWIGFAVCAGLAVCVPLFAASVWDPSNPAQFEALFRQHSESMKTAAASRDYGLFLKMTGDRVGAARVLRRTVAMEESGENIEALASVAAAGEALGLYEKAVKLRPSGDLLRRIGALQEARGNRADAEKRYREAIALYEKQLGAMHPKVAVALNDLGLLLENRSDVKGAEPVYRRALAIQEKAYGAVHPEVGTTLNNLGGVVGAGGRLSVAEPMLRRALRVLEQTLGPAHVRVATCATNLAGLLAAMDHKAEARALYERGAGIYERQGDGESAREARDAAGKIGRD